MTDFSRKYSIAFYISILLLILVIGLFLATAMQPLLILKYYKSAVDELAFKTGVNEYLLRALVFPFTVVFVIYGLFRIFRFKDSKKRRQGWIVVGVIVALFNLFIWIFTINTVVEKGKIYRFAAFTQVGWVLSEDPGEAVEYDVPYKKITKDNKIRIRDGEPPPMVVFEPQQEDFFDPKTGKGKVWFEVNENGEWIFYRYPGYSRRSGVWLNRMTPKYFKEYLKKAEVIKADTSKKPETVPREKQTITGEEIGVTQNGESRKPASGQEFNKEALSGVFVSVSEKVLGSITTEPISKSIIFEKLINAGFAVTENSGKAAYIVDVSITTKYISSEIDKYSNTCKAEGKIKIISGHDDSIVGVVNISDILGSSNKSSDPSVAAEDAIENIAPKIAEGIIIKLKSI